MKTIARLFPNDLVYVYGSYGYLLSLIVES